MRKIRATILIPILNEEEYLPTLFNNLLGYPDHFDILICDGGSTDMSLQLIKNSGYPYLHQKLEQPSIFKTISIGLDALTNEFTIIHPVDLLAKKSLQNLEFSDEDYGFFFKEYDESHFLLKIQCFFLNNVRSMLFKHFVWTNLFYLKTALLKEIKLNQPFLEDVLLSEVFIKRDLKRKIHKSLITVSSRRYLRNGILKQMMKNAFIMINYRLRLIDTNTLKSLYSK